MGRTDDPKDKAHPDFSSVQSGSSSTAPSSKKPTPAPPLPANRFRVYTVQKGDSLSKIAKHEYGDANAWRKIFEANKDIIKDPDLIYPGQELKIPSA
jgi:nucleoid-associated protein YgaU